MTETHPFLIVDTSYWHHEWEHCGVCGRGDKPDEPELPWHTPYEAAVEQARQEQHQEHPAHLAMGRGEPVVYVPGTGWLPR